MAYGPIYDESTGDDDLAMNTDWQQPGGTGADQQTGILGTKLDVPDHKDITFGTKDLAWIVPAVIAALSGRNGQQLAGSLAAGALKGKMNQNAADNQTALEVWKAKHPGKEKPGGGGDADVPVLFDPVKHGLQAIAAIKADPFHAQFYKSLFAMNMKKATPDPEGQTWA